MLEKIMEMAKQANDLVKAATGDDALNLLLEVADDAYEEVQADNEYRTWEAQLVYVANSIWEQAFWIVELKQGGK